MAAQASFIGQKNKKEQVYTDPWHMMNEAPRTPSFFTGSEVIKEAVRRASCDIMVAYPITLKVKLPPCVENSLLKDILVITSEGKANLPSCLNAREPLLVAPEYLPPQRDQAPCGLWKISPCGPERGCLFR